MAAVVTVTAVLALTACDPIGFGAQTNRQYDAGAGSNARGPHIQILNGLFVNNGDETATFSASLLNRDPETHTLTGAEIKGSDGSTITSTFAAPIELEQDDLYQVGKSGDIIMTGAFPPGGFVKVTLNFDNASPVTLNVPIVPRTATYASVATAAMTPATPATPSQDSGTESPGTEGSTAEDSATGSPGNG
jgi:hypothetical protein